jgi:hypothetical protein
LHRGAVRGRSGNWLATSIRALIAIFVLAGNRPYHLKIELKTGKSGLFAKAKHALS